MLAVAESGRTYTSFTVEGSQASPADDGEVTIAELEDWLLSGAHWRVVDIAKTGAEVEFRTCTGRPLERRQTHDPAVIEYLRTAHTEQD